MRIPNIRTLATLAPVAAGVVVVTQLHWAVAHMGTIGLAAAAVTGGAWLLTRPKGKPQELQADETESRSEGIGPQAAAYLDGIRAAGSLPQATQAPTWESQRVRAQITREV